MNIQYINKTQQKELIGNVSQIGHYVTFADKLTKFEAIQHASCAIIGICKNANNPYFLKIRQSLYHLYCGEKKLQIIDFGNIATENAENIISETNKLKIPIIFICDKNDTAASFFTSVGGKIVIATPNITDANILSKNIIKNSNIDTTFIAYQNYLSDPSIVAKLSKRYCTTLRLGKLRTQMYACEPEMRVAHAFFADLSSVRNCDGGSTDSPNGLYAEEFCQITTYAGLSENMNKLFLLCQNCDGTLSQNLAAQALWHFVDAILNRVGETEQDFTKLRKFIVNMGHSATKIIFYKSETTNRWWIEIGSGKNAKLAPCTFDDYKTACNNEVPVCWLWNTQKMKNKLNLK